ncbi:MAG: response regulator [Sulfuritalea sp.]|jgi:CheY-like chemotaxis protein|nr:response regulator [Sulfuritalea sp.]
MSALHKVLVVDDDPVVSKSFNRVLSQKGYVVVSAANAQEALNKVQEGEYDVVFTDIKMPGMSGIELAERLKVERPWTPVVIVTGFGSTSNQARAEAAGVSSFLQKPLSPEMIEGSMRKALLDAVPTILPGLVEAVSPAPVEQESAQESHLKKVGLFMAAPFIGLLYAVLFPFVGLGALAVFGIKAFANSAAPRKLLTFTKNVALFLAAPFLGLAYALMLPIVGVGTVAWIGIQALKKNPAAMKAVTFIASPFIGLAFIVALPIVGTAMLAWVGVQALIKKPVVE